MLLHSQHDDVVRGRTRDRRREAWKSENRHHDSMWRRSRPDDVPGGSGYGLCPREYDPWLVMDAIAYGRTKMRCKGIWWGGPGLLFWDRNSDRSIRIRMGMGCMGRRLASPPGSSFNHSPYRARGPAFFDRGGYYGGRRGFGRPEGFRGSMGDRGYYRGYEAPRGGSGIRSSAFSGFDHGGVSRGFSARGQGSFGGFRGGGFGGGGFRGGGGGRR